jgi:transposase-like protein
MSKRRRTFTPEFKAEVVLHYLTGQKTAAEICREHQLKDSLFYRWKEEFLAGAAQAFEHGQRSEDQQASAQRIVELEQMVGRLTMELDTAKKASRLLNSRFNGNER